MKLLIDVPVGAGAKECGACDRRECQECQIFPGLIERDYGDYARLPACRAAELEADKLRRVAEVKR